MPFTIGGEWQSAQPEKVPAKAGGKPVKVRVERRGQVMVTVILNLQKDKEELKRLASHLKKQCGTGGTVKIGEKIGESVIEIQGDQVEVIRRELLKEGIKAQ
jgi:translation initiation factor 1